MRRRGRADRHAGLFVLLRPRLEQPFIPEGIDFQAVRRYAPQVALRPRWLWGFAKTMKLPDLTVPNMVDDPAETLPTFFGAYGMWMASPMPTS